MKKEFYKEILAFLEADGVEEFFMYPVTELEAVGTLKKIFRVFKR